MSNIPPSASEVPRFTGFSTFCRLPVPDTNSILKTDKENIGVIGIPFDAGCTYRTGARFGPQAIRNASRIIRPYSIYHKFDLFDIYNCVDLGDLRTNPFNIQKSVDMISEQIDWYFNDVEYDNLFFLGGDHTISYPVLRSINKKFGKVSLIHFDSHYDTWDSYFGEKITHGTPFKRVFDEDLIDVSSSMHVGIRGTVNSKEDISNDMKIGFDTIFCHETSRLGIDGIIERIRQRVGENKVYISLDIDVVDPAFAPGTGTPECGGYSSSEILGIIRGLKSLNVIGGDVVEVCPSYDSGDITAHLAATICYELMCLRVPLK